MTIPAYQVDIDLPGHQVLLKFRDQVAPMLFVSEVKGASNVKNYAIAAEILRRNPRDEAAVNLAGWLDSLAAGYQAAD